MNSKTLIVAIGLIGLSAWTVNAEADVALGVRAGTLGVGPELSAALSPSWQVRLGYTFFNYTHDFTDSDGTYHGNLKLRNGSLLVDWRPGGGIFAITAGAVETGDRVDARGVPNNGTFTLNGINYSASEVGSVTGEIKPGHDLSPYVGLGVGTHLDSPSHWRWSLNAGAVFMGTPQVSLTANCSPSLPSVTCAQIQQNAVAEEADLRDHANLMKVWPVLDLGLAYRF